MRIDVYAHLLPPTLRRAVLGGASSSPDLVNWESLRPLCDLGDRLRSLDEHAIDVQFVCTPSPPLESLFSPARAQELAVLANDGMAEIVGEHPRRFRGIATIPIVDPEWAVGELRRSVLELGLAGPLLYTHVNGRPLDSPHLAPFWQELETLDVPAWLHPDRPRTTGDYRGEADSRYGLFLVLGWPYETSMAMARLVLSGIIARHPRLTIIAHHGGAMIPFFHRRIEMNYQRAGQRRIPALDDDAVDIPRDLRRFYVDTVLQGASAALAGAIDFFGPEQVMFATDMPFGPEDGRQFALGSISSVEGLGAEHRTAIFSENARRLFKIEHD